jgi:4-deoxy-L-threo-5-hexosulose-uronate ketol-isomerase
MNMDIRYGANPMDAAGYDTETLREEFLITEIFKADELCLTYSHVDRMVIGSAVPVKKAIRLEAQDELRADYFLERREIGIIDIAGRGAVTADGVRYELSKGDGLYLGRGTRSVVFESVDAAHPARFYFNSCPAHVAYPSAKVGLADAVHTKMGSLAECNQRTINKYFHPDGLKTCQLVMGMTVLEPGSVWNTIPCHTHERRMEAYMYFDIANDGIVFHYMGQPDETRHVVMHGEEAIISPSWSIHSGCGTGNYSFIWGMAGENQAFGDQDAVKIADLR